MDKNRFDFIKNRFSNLEEGKEVMCNLHIAKARVQFCWEEDEYASFYIKEILPETMIIEFTKQFGQEIDLEEIIFNCIPLTKEYLSFNKEIKDFCDDVTIEEFDRVLLTSSAF